MDLPCIEWHEHVEQKWDQLPIDQKRAFSALTEVDDIFAFGLSLVDHTAVQVLRVLSDSLRVQKSPQSAGKFREQGNQSFKARDYSAAVSHYSKGVCHAEQGEEELSLCLANRSAALYHLCFYQECLQDIGRALEHGYPSHLQQKLLTRKAQCLNRLEQSAQRKMDGISRNNQSISPEHWLPQAHGPGTVACASPAVSLQYSPGKGRHLLAVKNFAAGDVVLEERAFSSVLIPGGATVARRGKDSCEEVKDGGMNVEEQHCHQCLCQPVNPVPCQGCSYARYCGERCRQVAWDEHHRWECSIGGELRAAGVLAHLALRVALKVGLEEVQKARANGVHPSPVTLLATANESGRKVEVEKQKSSEEVEGGHVLSTASEDLPQGEVSGEFALSGNDTLIQGCDPSGCYRGDSYRCVYHLLPHLSGHKPAIRFLHAVTAATLCLRLRGEGPLPEAWGGGGSLMGSDSRGQCEGLGEGRSRATGLSVLGATVLKHLLQLRCNAQAVTALKDQGVAGSAVQAVQEVRIATAIFPSLSLLNHSCSPNTSMSFRTDSAPGQTVTVTVRATQALAAGQELLHCYGPHQSRMPVRERRRLLQEQYFFLCQCSACCQELGSELKGQGAASPAELYCLQCGAALQDGEDGYVCSRSSCDFQLSRADLQHRLRDLRGRLEQAERLIERSRADDAVRGLKTASERASRFLPETDQLRGELADMSARAHAATGEWRQAAAQLKCSLAAIRAQYGGQSVELGRQLFKLAQLHFNGGEPGPALRVIPEARRLLLLHCDPSCEELLELQAMEACLQGAL